MSFRWGTGLYLRDTGGLVYVNLAVKIISLDPRHFCRPYPGSVLKRNSFDFLLYFIWTADKQNIWSWNVRGQGIIQQRAVSVSEDSFNIQSSTWTIPGDLKRLAGHYRSIKVIVDTRENTRQFRCFISFHYSVWTTLLNRGWIILFCQNVVWNICKKNKTNTWV